MKIIETIKCRDCGIESQFEINDTDTIGRMFLPCRCQPCQDIEDERRRHERETLDRETHDRMRGLVKKAIADQTDPAFRRTDINHQSFNRAGWNRIANWRPTSEKPWLGLVGSPGACKTRAAHLLAARIIEGMVSVNRPLPKFALATSTGFCKSAMTCASGSFDDRPEARAYIDRMRTADFLLIDDLGKGRFSPAVTAEFFELVDHRHRHELPTIWTANSEPSQVLSGIGADYAGPIIGRFHDSSLICKFEKL